MQWLAFYGSLLCTLRLAYSAVYCARYCSFIRQSVVHTTALFSAICYARYGSFIRQSFVHATALFFGNLLCTRRLSYTAVCCARYGSLIDSPLCKLRLTYTAVCCARYGSLIRQSVMHATARLYGSLLCKLRLTD
jgi:hypothetical protein